MPGGEAGREGMPMAQADGQNWLMESDRLRFSFWTQDDLGLARSLWGNPQVTRYICATGTFTGEEIAKRLALEIGLQEHCGVQYWPLFERETGTFVGCCGLHPRKAGEYELGFHLLPEFWGRGYASEAAARVVRFAAQNLDADVLFAGHHPMNSKSGHVLGKLGFSAIGTEYYAPTGLMHPSYELHLHGVQGATCQPFQIRPAVASEMGRLMEIYADGRRALAALGIDQWQNGQPRRDMIEADVARGETFVVADAEGIGGVAMIGAGGEPTYDSIDGAWLTGSDSSNPNYLVVHRIATAADHAHRGMAKALLAFAEGRARELGRTSVRIDTHQGNIRMRTLMRRLGYTECGIILLEPGAEGTRERVAFEKLVCQ